MVNKDEAIGQKTVDNSQLPHRQLKKMDPALPSEKSFSINTIEKYESPDYRRAKQAGESKATGGMRFASESN